MGIAVHLVGISIHWSTLDLAKGRNAQKMQSGLTTSANASQALLLLVAKMTMASTNSPNDFETKKKTLTTATTATNRTP